MLQQVTKESQLDLCHQGEEGVQCVLEQARLALARDPGSVEAGGELVVVVKDLDVHVLAVEEDHGLHAAGHGTLEVVRVATLDVAVESRLATEIARCENLEEIEFTATGGPARALGLAVLKSARDLSVEHPDGGHIVVGGSVSLAVKRHLELEEESLLSTSETVVGDLAVTVVATVTIALLVRHDDDLIVGGKLSVGENLRRRSTSITLAVRVRERVSESVVEDTRALATVVVEEDDVVSRAGLRIVVSLASPGSGAASGSGRR
jgi:hypothetical protein